MKVLGINGSPKMEGNTYRALKAALEEAENFGFETDIVHVGTTPISGCTSCGDCQEKKNAKCSIENDMVNEVIEKLLEADGVIIASPVFFGGISGPLKCLLDRVFYSAFHRFKGKVGACIVAQKRFLVLEAIEQVNTFYKISNMIPSGYGFLDTSLKNQMGMQDMRGVGKRLSQMILNIKEMAREKEREREGKEDKLII